MITKFCLYKATNYNLLPAILITLQYDGVIIARKVWYYHVGVQIRLYQWA
jgi:hypothetical protein